MYELEMEQIDRAISCLTDMHYDEVKYILDLDEDDIELVVKSCNEIFDEMNIDYYVDYKDGYFERVEM